MVYAAPAPERAHNVPKCLACGYEGPWQVEPVLLTHHIVITIILFFLYFGGLIYLLITLIWRSSEDHRAKICPRCAARNMHTFVYADGLQPQMVVAPQYAAQPAQAPAPAGIPQAPSAPRTVFAPGPSAAVSVNGVPVTSIPLAPGGKFTVGRNPSSTVVVSDSMVSGQHAVLEVHDGGVVSIYDAGSTNGTFVNGNRLSGAHRIGSGDVVTLGSDNTRLSVAQA